MPYTLKPNKIFAKDPNGEGYLPQNVVTDQSTAEQVALINSAGAAQVSAIQEKGAETLDSIPDDYTALQGEVDDLKSAVDNGQKRTGNLFNFQSNSWTYNGVTVNNNWDGTYTANGSATASTYFDFCDVVVSGTAVYTVKVVQISGTGPSAGIRFFPKHADGSNIGNYGAGTHTLTYQNGNYFRFRIAQSGDTLTNFVFAIYVSEGDTAIEEPYSKWLSEYAVRYDVEQTITNNEMALARQNIDAASNADIDELNTEITNTTGRINRIFFSCQYGVGGCYFETDGTSYLYIKITGSLYLRGFKNNGSGTATQYENIVPDNRYTSPSGVADCIRLGSNYGLVYDLSDLTWKVVNLGDNTTFDVMQIPVFVAGFFEGNKQFGVVAGIGQYLYEAYWAAQKIANATSIYGTEEHAEQAKAVIDKALKDKDANTITFGLITDSHHRGSYNAVPQANIFNRMCEKCADFTVHLGDTIQGMQTLDVNYQYITQYAEAQNDTFLPFMYTIAHHEMYGRNSSTDYLNDPTAIPMESVLGILGRTKWIDPVYSVSKDNWYFDMKGVRFISLDSVHNTTNGFNQEAIDFLTSAVNTQNKIIVFAHVAANANVNWKNKNPVNGSQIESILNGSSADVLAYMHGHTHWDNIVVVSGNNFPYISTCCALAERMSSSNYCSLGTPTAYDREVGSYSEYCFDIVNVHTDTGTIKSFRFGVGSDRTYTQPI